METQKNDEKNIVLELKRQLGRMMVQVDYMYRNDREMSRLDLDILMERTRDLYDLLCDYQSGKVEIEPEKPEVVETEINEGGEFVNLEPDINGENDGDDKGLDFKDEEPEEEPEEEPAAEEPVEVVKKHILPVDESDFCDDENEVFNANKIEEADDEDWEDDDDEMFRVEQPVENTPVEEEKPAEEEKPVEEDNSLAAKLQRTPISDIRMALGINDKVMIINELFMGSVERYNKAIDALNDFPTLSGARVYMSELQIELQWDTDTQAYKMLNDLVERRFI